LDSAAAYDIISLLRAAVRAFHHTCFMTLLQPPPEVFALFDEVGDDREEEEEEKKKKGHSGPMI